MPRFAAIDVGSNAMRLRIIDAIAPSLRPADFSRVDLSAANGSDREIAAPGRRDVTTLRASVRLGSEVFLTGRLTPGSISQACDALRSFRQAMDDANVSAYRAVATSAVREAKNGSTLVERARREAGIELDVIEGIEEARLIQLAVNHRLPTADKKLLLVDVGGGSTELTLLDDGKHTFSISLPLGTVRLLEAYVQGGLLDAERIRLLEESIDRGLVEAKPNLEGAIVDAVFGTGGNIETLLELCPQKGGHAGYPRAIDVRAMRALFQKLSRLSPAERRDQYNLRPDRADTIIPAMVIFLRVADALVQPAIVAPGVGLAAGVLEELVDRYYNVWDEEGEAASVLQACRRLGQRYHYDEAHADLVAEFSASLFDDLSELHRFSSRDKLLLRAAALLHDIGDFVHYNGHHKHSYYLIQHADIIGLRPEERAIVANIARYHRKSAPDVGHPNFRELDKDARGKVSGLAAILRIADALDREHCAKVTGVRATMNRAKGTISLRLEGREDCELEEWTVKAKAGLLRDVYDLDVVIEK